MSLLRTIRQPNLLRSLAPRSSTTPAISVAGRRFAHQDYGSGEAKSDQAANKTQRDAEHPGPPPPKAAQQGKGQQEQQPQQSSGGDKSKSNSNSTSNAQPKILSDNPPAQGEESEEVAKHNREVSQRADRAEEKVNNEDAEKDKVPKGFWYGRKRQSAVMHSDRRLRITTSAVKITAGTDDQESFIVHDTILSDRSPFFKAAISKRWQAGRNGEVHLPEDEPFVVGAYFDWLYSSNIASKSEKPFAELQEDEIDAELEYLCKLYVFGEKILDNEFCNAVVSAITARVDEDHDEGTFYPGTKAVRILYEGTGEGCPARKMMVQFYMEHGAEEWFGMHGEKHSQEFLTDMCKEFLKMSDPMPAVRQWEKRAQWFKYTCGIITIKAGDGEARKTLSIHEDIIKSSSPFFRAALDKNWKEAQSREITLPSDSAEVVSCYVDWCYSKQIASTHLFSEQSLRDLDEEDALLADLYVFGEKVQDDRFCNAVMTAMAELMDQEFVTDGVLASRSPGPSTVKTIYDGTPTDSPARRFLVDQYVAYGSQEWFDGNDEYLQCPEFLRDLALAQLRPKAVFRDDGDYVRDRCIKWFKPPIVGKEDETKGEIQEG
ncbi:hypothetical protein PRZ48_012923 [Zasmidium cellare]|uniref:BTB domain-containing protein n=1 Tax=Zasmidium cellare TaxID=395010 RepID=A0ABR0E2Z2_ZASCE|nr:hypothetical protein PRZ48_012923 [Zasmidium cellare]